MRGTSVGRALAYEDHKPVAQKRAEEAARAAIKAAAPDDLVKAIVPGDDAAGQAAQGNAAIQKADELFQIGHAAGRLAARQAFLKTPQGLKGGEAEKWADEKLINLLPDAVAEVEYQLKFGDDVQREKAASKVLEATGRARREGGGGSTAPIIILTGSAIVKPPWAQKESKQVVDGELVDDEKK